MILCFWILTITASALAGINFAYSALKTLEGDKEQIVITDPGGSDPQVFLGQIDQALEVIDQDIMFRYIDMSGDKPHYKYFKTNHTTEFIKIPAEANNILPEPGQCYSTVLNQCSNAPLKVPANYQAVTISNWYDAADFDLSKANYFVNASHAQETAGAIQSLGYAVEMGGGVTLYLNQLDPQQFLFVPAFMFVLSAMFYSFSNGKRNVLMKMEGYTTVNILQDEARKNRRWLGISLLIVISSTLITSAVLFRHAFIQFCLFYLRYLLILLGVLIVSGLLTAIIVKSQDNAEFAKGRVPKKGMYLTTMFGKIVFLIFLLFSLSIGIRDIIGVVNSIRTIDSIQERIEGYVTIPINESNASSADLEKNYLEFYNLTVDQHEGVLIDAGNYYYDVMTGSNSSIEYGQDFITINENYLDLNPVYVPSGVAIGPDMFSDTQYNVLIPVTKRDEKAKYTEWIDLWYGQEVNFIEYDSSRSEIYSYNPGVGSDSLGRLDQPVILMFDEGMEYAGVYIDSFCSTGSYFLKTYTDDPYQELMPILEQAGIYSVTLRTPYISDNFNDLIAFQLSNFRLYLSQSAFFLLGLISLILFSVQLYCENYKQKIASSLIEGATIMGYMRSHFVITGATYLLTAAALGLATRFTPVTINYTLLIGAIVLELIITVVSANKIANRNLYLIVKGAE